MASINWITTWVALLLLVISLNANFDRVAAFPLSDSDFATTGYRPFTSLFFK